MLERDHWSDAVVQNRQRIEPISTDISSRLTRLTEIRAVIFDVYGTLVISASGEVGSADNDGRSETIASAMKAVGIDSQTTPSIEDLHRHIRDMNEQRRSDRCPHPEVDIIEAWRRTLRPHFQQVTTASVIELAAEYECRANPTWPMPGASEVLGIFKRAGLTLGIVSNAQEFTIPLVQDLLPHRSWIDGGFDLDLSVFSNRFRQAKPGPRLFDVLVAGLAKGGIRPDQAIYVGNDMLNDIWAASQAGMKTAWFAGDARSCRRRAEDPRCEALEPDLVLTELMQLPGCLELQ